MQSSRAGDQQERERNPGTSRGQGGVAVLWTGFRAFGAHAVNPSMWVAQAAADARGKPDEYDALDVTWAVAAKGVGAWFEHPGQRAVVHVGLAADRSWVSLETAAYNGADGTLDVVGCGRGALLDEAAPASRETLLDTAALRDSLARRTSLQIRCTDDPGRFICNATYFTSLAHAEKTGSVALFVHIPLMEREAAIALGRALADALTEVCASPSGLCPAP